MTPEPQIKDYLPAELLAKLEEILSQQLRSLDHAIGKTICVLTRWSASFTDGSWILLDVPEQYSYNRGPMVLDNKGAGFCLFDLCLITQEEWGTWYKAREAWKAVWERWFNQIPKQTPVVSFEEERDDCFRVNAKVGSVWIGTFTVTEEKGRFIMSAEYQNSEGMGTGGGHYHSMDVATEAGKDWIKLQWGRTWQQYLEEPTT